MGALGGATSIDQQWRTVGLDWWPQERILRADVDTLGDDPLDVLITHEVPAGVPVVGMNVSRVDPATLAEADEGRRLVRRAVERTQPRVVLSGHWHQRLTHDLALSPGGSSRCEVLPDESDRRNAMAMDVADLDAPLVELSDWVRAREGRDPEELVIGAYHRLFQIEKSFRMAKSDLAARPIYARTKDSIEAHLSIVFAALAVGRWIEETTGWSIRRFVKTARRYRTIDIDLAGQTITAADPLPHDLATAIEAIKHRAAAH